MLICLELGCKFGTSVMSNRSPAICGSAAICADKLHDGAAALGFAASLGCRASKGVGLLAAAAA